MEFRSCQIVTMSTAVKLKVTLSSPKNVNRNTFDIFLRKCLRSVATNYFKFQKIIS